MGVIDDTLSTIVRNNRIGLTFDANDVIPDLLGDDRVRYELDEIVYGVYGRVHALEPLDLLADGQRVVGKRRVAEVVRRTAVHCYRSVTSRTSLETEHDGRIKAHSETADGRTGRRRV